MGLSRDHEPVDLYKLKDGLMKLDLTLNELKALRCA